MNTIIKEHFIVKDKTYQLTSHFFDKQSVVYRIFIVTHDGMPVLVYNLGITKIALIIYNENSFKPEEWLFNTGRNFIEEMISENILRKSGVITSHEMSKMNFNWMDLVPLQIDKDYTY